MDTARILNGREPEVLTMAARASPFEERTGREGEPEWCRMVIVTCL